MRGKIGLVERFVKPLRFEVTSTSAFASVSGSGEDVDPTVIVLSGNTTPSVNRQATVVAKVSGVWKFSCTASGGSMGAVEINGMLYFAFAGGLGHGDFGPISVVVDDVLKLFDYGGDYADEITASFWIE